MKLKIFPFFFMLLAISAREFPRWVYGARIATPYDLEAYWGDWKESVRKAVEDGARVILDWSEAGNSWKCLYDPCLSREIQKIRSKAEFVHSHFPGVKIILYVAPLEYVTHGLDSNGDGKVDPGKRQFSLFLNHTDWVQMGISGRRAVFFGSYPEMPFWVCASCEDVWLTPAHPRVRELHLRQAEKLAQSGADGLWLDVPFLLYDYGETWVNQWPDLGPDARSMFKQDTGKSLPAPPFSPDWSSEAWLRFVRWRYKLIRDFVSKYNEALKGKNRDFLLAIETSVDYTVALTQTASDPKDMAEVADLVAHEIGGVEETAQAYTWLYFLARLKAWRDIDLFLGKPSWSLSYVFSWAPDLENTVKLHAASLILNGFSYYTSGNETMSGVPNPSLRKRIFKWIGKNLNLYNPSILPYSPIGVVFSRRSLDYSSQGRDERGDYADGFYGTVMLLLQSHLPFVVIHEDFLARMDLSHFSLLILPDMRAISDEEAEILRKYVKAGGKIIATAQTSLWDELGRERERFALSDVFGIDHPGNLIHENRFGKGFSLYCGFSWEKEFLWAASPWDVEGGEASWEDAEFYRNKFLKLISRAGLSFPIKIKASPWMIPTFWCTPSGMEIRFVNLKGIRFGNSSPSKSSVEVQFPSPISASYLPFLGFWKIFPARANLNIEINFGGVLRANGIYLPQCFLHFFSRKK